MCPLPNRRSTAPSTAKDQRSDWTSHKPHCHPSTPPSQIWYDKYRKCKDGNKHEGRLELITWSTPANEHEDWSEDMGWGNVIVAEAEDLKRKFEREMNGDEAKLYKYWPQAFRWTCCDTVGNQRYGCDHHGRGSTPCSCDFCKMGKRIPDGLHNKRVNSAAGKGLKFSRGPDPRSINRLEGGIAEAAREILGMLDSKHVA
ncbi:hypothetical protein XPA_010597 [Xanthoria parietina]